MAADMAAKVMLLVVPVVLVVAAEQEVELMPEERAIPRQPLHPKETMAVRQQALLQLMAVAAEAGLALLVVTDLELLEDRAVTEQRHQFLVLA
jgi:hypothetical protein